LTPTVVAHREGRLWLHCWSRSGLATLVQLYSEEYSDYFSRLSWIRELQPELKDSSKVAVSSPGLFDLNQMI